MKNIVKFPLGLWVLLSASVSSQPLNARMHHLWFDDSSFYDNSWIDSAKDLYERSMMGLKEHVANIGPSKEQQEAYKEAQTKLKALKQEISEDDSKVTIRFSGFEHLDKKDIKIVRKKYGWKGLITLNNGALEFFIRKNGIHIVRRVELRNAEGDQKAKSVFFSSSSASESKRFEKAIALETLKAEPVKNNTLIITANKKKEEILPLS
ncbi:hypothetical protein H0W26_03590, partial [Candidatus Dependentiae bacterium]|nr:hypothetical protein [Candidatus Dependentiae bacterium]